MELRFLNGLDPQQVADQLFMSRRHFYRELTQSVDVCADLLWQKYEINSVEGSGNLSTLNGESTTTQTRLDLLRVEAAQFHDTDRSVSVNKIINEVLNLVDEPAARQGTEIQSSLDEYLPAVRIDHSILRQILFGLFNLLLPFAGPRGIRVSTLHSQDEALMTCSAELTEPPEELRYKAGEQMSILKELAEINSARLQFVDHPPQTLDIILALPIAVRRKILIADDNTDLRRLIASYLYSTYTVIEARTGVETIRLAHEVQPFVILLDLMMPDRDGWDVLQNLKNDPQTSSIPIVICSVLEMKDLALSMGAANLLAKPVSEQGLLSLLNSFGG